MVLPSDVRLQHLPLARRPPQAGTPVIALFPEPPAGSRPGRTRLMPRHGERGVQQFGLRLSWHDDLYHRALTLRWWNLILLGTGLYLGVNVLFAICFLAVPGSIANARPGSFADAFFFSFQTMATIGYGVMAPATLYANLLVTAETLIGMLVVAMAAGLAFARFSRPTARVLFSEVAVIAPHDGVPTLALRLANQRHNQILQAEVTLTLLRNERTPEGMFMRRFYDLDLARQRTPIFALTFTVLHPIDQRSPLHGATVETLTEADAELLVTVTGLDETMSQTIHARYSYSPDELLWDHWFVDILGFTAEGRRAIDYTRFHETRPWTE